MMADERIPVMAAAGEAALRAAASPDTALVLRHGETVPGAAAVAWLPLAAAHPPGCACCAPRAALAAALHGLFLRRARGEIGFFRRVVVSLPEEALATALADPLVASRFRAERGGSREGCWRCA